jgi:hypothetical protein
MQHAYGSPVQSFQLDAPQPLMQPDGLEQTLGGKAVFVLQNVRGAALITPGSVKTFSGRVQSKLLLLLSDSEVNLF